MFTVLNLLVLLWLVTVAIAWTTLVPAAMTGWTFGWLSLVTAAFLLVIVATSRNARASVSIAQVLNEAERRAER